jgi:hypothetical protein
LNTDFAKRGFFGLQRDEAGGIYRLESEEEACGGRIWGAIFALGATVRRVVGWGGWEARDSSG